HERIHALPVTGGASTYRRSIEPPEALLRATDTLLSHLRWHGVAMVEFKVAPDGDFRLMEINPRLWGSLPLAVAAGTCAIWRAILSGTGNPGSNAAIRFGSSRCKPLTAGDFCGY